CTGVGERPGEGPYVFRWRGHYWMLVDLWKGLGVYRSEDLQTWTAQPDNLLGIPGKGTDDGVNGGHPGVVVSGDRAFCFYFTHPGRSGTITPQDKDSLDLRRSSIQVVELAEKDGRITCDRDTPTHIALAPPAAGGVTWSNPVVKQRADPHITYHTDGYYYFTATVPEYDRLELRRARTLDALATAEPKTIWRRHPAGPMGSHIWAPELHRIGGRWYVYFAAGGAEKETTWNIRIYVLENASANPLDGEWTERGQLKTNWESFALDATTFEHRGTRYLAWAQKDPKIKGNTNLYLAKMDSPTSISGAQVMLSKPDLPWEQIRYWVNEGPAVLLRNGRVWLTYSAAGTGAEYCLGLLSADENADLLDPASWKKSPTPVFATHDANGVFGPGHNSFATSADGKSDLLVYHARSYRDIPGDPLQDPNRHTRIQKFTWRADGSPDFGVPAADGPVSPR
ncbi:MAG: family 43 glycosylhydrolase, partial [Verrucomicrobia bacterium]|nr:family 43 glycosylhydrolase [Verrucomicrobiota bacterium]